jgi:hypothetical protein
MKSIITVLCLLAASSFAQADAVKGQVSGNLAAPTANASGTATVMFLSGALQCSPRMPCISCHGYWSLGNQGDITKWTNTSQLVRGRTYTFETVWNGTMDSPRGCALPEFYYLMDGRKYSTYWGWNRLTVPNR